MPDNTSTPTAATDSTLLANDATGIYAPVRFTHITPKQRYGWRAALIILVHALVLALVLLRLDLLASAPHASSPEALDIIVVDLSGTSELSECTPIPRPLPKLQPLRPSLPLNRPRACQTTHLTSQPKRDTRLRSRLFRHKRSQRQHPARMQSRPLHQLKRHRLHPHLRRG